MSDDEEDTLTTTINARVPQALRAQLDTLALARDCSRGLIVREALEYYLPIAQKLRAPCVD